MCMFVWNLDKVLDMLIKKKNKNLGDYLCLILKKIV